MDSRYVRKFLWKMILIKMLTGRVQTIAVDYLNGEGAPVEVFEPDVR